MEIKYVNLGKLLEVVDYRESDTESLNRLLKLPYKYIDDTNQALLEIRTMLHSAIETMLRTNKLVSKTPATLFLIGELLGLKNIEDYIIFIVDCLEYHEQFEECVSFSKVFGEMYPNGFYSPKTVNDLYPVTRNLPSRQKLK